MLRTAISLAICVLLLASSDALAGKRYTARLADKEVYSMSVNQILFSPDSSQLLVSTDRATHVVLTEGAELAAKLQQRPFSMNYSKDGSRALLIGGGRRLFDMNLGTEIKQDFRSEPGYMGLTIDRKNGKLIFTVIDPGSPCDTNGKIHIGDELVAVGNGRNGPMQSVTGRSPQRAIGYIKGSAGTFLRLAVIADGELKEKTHVLRRLARKQVDGKNVYLPFETVKLDDHVAWCLSGGHHQFSSARTGKPVSAFRPQNLAWNRGTRALSPDSKHFAWIGQCLNLRKYRKMKSHMAEEFLKTEKISDKKSGSTTITKARIQATADNTASGSTIESNYGVEIYDIGTQELLATFPIESESVNTWVPVKVFHGARFSRDGKQLIVGTRSKLHVYDIASGRKLKEIAPPAYGGSPPVGTFDVSDRLAAVGNTEGKMTLLDLESGRIVKEIDSPQEAKLKNKGIRGVALSPDGKWLAYVIHKVLHIVDVSDF